MASAVESVFALLLTKVTKKRFFKRNKPQINPKTIKSKQKSLVVKTKNTA